MADNSDRTPGTGETIRSVDRSDIKTQVMGLDVAASGEDERLGLPPNRLVTATAAGLTTATTPYSAGDQMGTELTFANVARDDALGAVIQSALLMVKTPSVALAIDLFLFSASVTPAADNAAWSFSDADMAKLVGVIEFRAAKNGALNAVLMGLGLPQIVVPAATSLFGHFICQATQTAHFGSAADMVATLGITKD